MILDIETIVETSVSKMNPSPHELDRMIRQIRGNNKAISECYKLVITRFIHNHMRIMKSGGRSERSNVKQIECIVNFMDQHRNFANRQDLGVASVKKYKSMMESLAAQLSSLGPPSRTVKQTEAMWTELKKRSKNEAQRFKKAHEATGNPRAPEELSEITKKVMDIIGIQTTVQIRGVFPSGMGLLKENEQNLPNILSTATPSTSSTMTSGSYKKICTSAVNEAISSVVSSMQTDLPEPPPKKSKRLTVRESFHYSQSKKSVAEKLTDTSSEQVKQIIIQNMCLARMAIALEKVAGIENPLSFPLLENFIKSNIAKSSEANDGNDTSSYEELSFPQNSGENVNDSEISSPTWQMVDESNRNESNDSSATFTTGQTVDDPNLSIPDASSATFQEFFDSFMDEK